MNEFNTKLIELLEKICEYIPANKADERVVELFKELHELNEQEIEQDNSTPLEDLDFSVRTYNCLKRYGVNTLEQLKEMSFNEFKTVRNLGNKSIKEIYQFFMGELSK